MEQQQIAPLSIAYHPGAQSSISVWTETHQVTNVTDEQINPLKYNI